MRIREHARHDAGGLHQRDGLRLRVRLSRRLGLGIADRRRRVEAAGRWPGVEEAIRLAGVRPHRRCAVSGASQTVDARIVRASGTLRSRRKGEKSSLTCIATFEFLRRAREPKNGFLGGSGGASAGAGETRLGKVDGPAAAPPGVNAIAVGFGRNAGAAGLILVAAAGGCSGAALAIGWTVGGLDGPADGCGERARFGSVPATDAFDATAAASLARWRFGSNGGISAISSLREGGLVTRGGLAPPLTALCCARAADDSRTPPEGDAPFEGEVREAMAFCLSSSLDRIGRRSSGTAYWT